jgi:hypothetical protein
MEIFELQRTLLTLLFAYPHKWGPGAVHILDFGQDKTVCGKTRELCELF